MNTAQQLLYAVDTLRWSVMPLRINKKPCLPTWKPYQTRRPTLDEIDAWVDEYNVASWAVITGEISGILILDFDGPEGAELLKELGFRPHVRTGSGGFHVYFRHPGYPVKTLNAKAMKALPKGLDIRADGGYAAFTGRNETGTYDQLRPFEELESVEDIPSELRRLLTIVPPADEHVSTPAPAGPPTPPRPPAETRYDRATTDYLLSQALQSVANGSGRDNSCFSLACQLRDNLYSESEARDVLAAFVAQVPATDSHGRRDPFTMQTADRKLQSAYSQPARRPTAWGKQSQAPNPPSSGIDQQPANAHSASNEADSEPEAAAEPEPEPDVPPAAIDKEQCSRGFMRTDLGNGQRLRFRHGKDLRYCHVWGKWLVWDRRRFRLDETGSTKRRAFETVRSIYNEASHEQDSGNRKEITQHAVRSESNSAINAMLSIAQNLSGIPIRHTDPDADRYAFNCLNGTLDLQTFTLRPHRRDDLITKLAPVVYDAAAECPQWLKFLHKIFNQDAGMVEFIQRAVGYSLTADISEKVLFILHGSGRNGKSPFLETIHAIMGDYAMKTPQETLMQKKGTDIPNDIARLQGARFVYASETKEGGRLNENVIKDLTGEKIISARFMRGEWFEFERSWKLWLGTNHRPLVSQDQAVWDRIRLIPFEVRLPDDPTDPDFLSREKFDRLMKAEYSGILAWAVRGLRKYYEDGQLQPPAAVAHATAAYREEMDTLGRFASEVIETAFGYKVKTTEVYARYKEWSQANGEMPNSQKLFDQRFMEKAARFPKLRKWRDGRAGMFYLNIRLRSAEELATPEAEPEYDAPAEPETAGRGFKLVKGVKGDEGKNSINNSQPLIRPETQNCLHNPSHASQEPETAAEEQEEFIV